LLASTDWPVSLDARSLLIDACIDKIGEGDSLMVD